MFGTEKKTLCLLSGENRMNSDKTILIASNSKAILVTIQNRIDEAWAKNCTVGVLNDEELKKNLNKNKVRYLLIEGSFYREATPDELFRLLKKYLSLRIYVFDYHEYPDYFLKSLLRIGVEGFLDLRQGKDGFMKDLKNALAGQLPVPKQFTGMSFDYPPMEVCNLTDRDMEIVHLIIYGYENREIADSLNLKLQSVKNRRRAIYDKLHVTNTVDFLRQIIIKGVIDLEEFLRR
jgi:DNA-binding NarL/FixJ family response regulator